MIFSEVWQRRGGGRKYRFLPESKVVCTAESLARARSARARDSAVHPLDSGRNLYLQLQRGKKEMERMQEAYTSDKMYWKKSSSGLCVCLFIIILQACLLSHRHLFTQEQGNEKERQKWKSFRS